MGIGYSLRYLRCVRFACAALLMFAVVAGVARGQTPASGAQAGEGSAGPVVVQREWTAEDIQRRRKEISDSEGIEAEVKSRLLETYDKALAELKDLEQYRAQRSAYARERDAAPAELEKVRAQLSEVPAEPKLEIDSQATAADLEEMVTAAQTEHDELARQATGLDNELKRREDRRTRIPEEIAALKEQVGQVQARLGSIGPEASPEVQQANRLLLEIRQAKLEAQAAMLEAEQRYYGAAMGLLTARRELAGRLAAESQTKLRKLRDAFQEARRVQAERLQAETAAAAREAMYAHPVVRSLAEENARLAERATTVIGQTEDARVYGRGLQSKLDAVERDFKEVREQVDSAERVTQVMGIMLLTKRSGLPELGANRQRLRLRAGRASEAQFTYLTFERQWSGLADTSGAGRELLENAGVREGDDGYAAVYGEVVKLLGEQRDIVRKISEEYRIYSGLLAWNDRTERRLIKEVESFARFIDERILWVRSSPTILAEDAASMKKAVRWFGSPSNWRGALGALWRDIAEHPASYGLFLAVLGALIYERRRMIGAMGRLTKRVGTKYSDSFWHTWKTLGLTVVLAAPISGALLFLSWRLGSAAEGDGFSESLAAGLLACGWIVALYRLGVFFCYEGGLGEQLGFDPEVTGSLSRHFKWFFSLLIPLTFLAAVFMSRGMDAGERNSLGRLLFVGYQGVLAVFLAIAFQPQGPVLHRYMSDHADGVIAQFRYVWYAGLVGLPLALSALALSGYFYAAQHLNRRLAGTILFVGAMVFLNAFLRRWLSVAEKRISIRRKRQQLAARAEEAAKAEGEEKKPAAAAAELSEEAHAEQMGLLSRQAMRLMQVANVVVLAVGLWWLWGDLLPALEGLRSISLWSTADADGTAITVVSLAGLIRAVVLVALTVIVARNLPGLVEMVILQRLSLEPGSRFAITTLCRYVIVVTGVILTFGELGIGWSKVQWLVAAMTVGLGFGLQEIFANFVSGLIILFEQPIRVGDMVTIGDVSGRVTQIRIRATTVRKYDQKELVVPNKEFITGRLVNWSLSDKLLRIDFRVGVAYGSDIAKTEEILYRVASENPLVLHDQMPPAVVFRGFGDSALDFELRIYVPNMDNYLKVWHEINCAIDREFRKAGVEIAFPQRDLHIRSGTLGVRLERAEGQGEGSGA